MSALLLEIVEACRHYGAAAHASLAPVSSSVDAGDFMVITGPSGSGKSTLLNLIGGLDVPTGGKILMRGQDIHALEQAALANLRNRTIGFVFQTPHLLSDRTVLENVLLPFQYGSAVATKASRDRAFELLAYVGLDAFHDRRPNTLSGGEMQRVVFARALARDPELILADEPTGSLDVDNSERILNLLREQAIQGRAVVMATHDPFAIGYGARTLELQKAVEIGRR